MEYKLKGVFDRNNEYTINIEETLNTNDILTITICKINSESKSYSQDNIECFLKCVNYNGKNRNIILDKDNFSGFYMLIEKFKRKGCFSMGMPVELIQENIEENNINLSEADEVTKKVFKDSLEKNKINEILFNVFMSGVTYGKEMAKSK